ncbi:MAG: hypothetical protein K9K66_14195 [Desulfarculaceae bacterium]|nr:hypothetical protein [Desulfarculaceae bacterium]MCF8073823.1 hypothetical protein [Desulfarculaceae bacterium]MCF8102803.1 hypothetical protein [Desulfarculaceae bacterium]MCF8116247.1 hypothetical protein [Desulfarculaceae bacterium]
MYSRIARVTALCLGLVLCASVALAEDYISIFHQIESRYWSASPQFRTQDQKQEVTKNLKGLFNKFHAAVISPGCVKSVWQDLDQAQSSLDQVLDREEGKDLARVAKAPASEKTKLRALANQQKNADDMLSAQLKGISSRARQYFCP